MNGAGHAAYPGDLFEHLRSFSTLAARLERGGRGAFEEAAHELAVDVSVLRRRLASLAAWAGAPLLAGRGARLKLTDAGREALAAARRTLAEIDALAARLGKARPRLAVGCTGTVATELLPGALARLLRAEPELELHVRRAGAEASAELLARGELDLAVVRAEGPPSEGARRLTADRLFLAVAKDHPLARRARGGRLSLERIAREPLVAYRKGSQTRARVMAVLEPLGARVRVEVDNKAAALRYAELGLGVAFVSLLPGHRPETPAHLVDLTPRFPPSAFWLLWAHGRPMRPLERALEAAMVSVLKATRRVPGPPRRSRRAAGSRP